MARDWDQREETRQLILQRMAQHGINAAEIPLYEWKERRGDEHVWVVEVHVKIPLTNEFDVQGEGLTLAEALRKAYLALTHEPILHQGR